MPRDSQTDFVSSDTHPEPSGSFLGDRYFAVTFNRTGYGEPKNHLD
ncbi:MAG: hypothetical protein QOF73_4647 [Thermomicrobiales bacterium]|jgi:hypothetical protein|nr:hypothetical protein [Thermomicrobiales bacterium]